MRDVPRKGDPRKASMKTHNTPLKADPQTVGFGPPIVRQRAARRYASHETAGP